MQALLWTRREPRSTRGEWGTACSCPHHCSDGQKMETGREGADRRNEQGREAGMPAGHCPSAAGRDSGGSGSPSGMKRSAAAFMQ
jgi:hypothetical protein